MKRSDLIEILRIEGNEVAVSRRGVNNCMVNLTQMAKPYGQGRDVAHWLRLKSTQEYLKYRNRSHHTDLYNGDDSTYGGQIIIVQGGNDKNRQGTWCTDFHIALDFAIWLDPVRKDIVYDTFIKYLTGRNVGTLVNTNRFPAPKEREGFLALEAALRRYTSIENLKRIAEARGVTLGHVKSVLKGNKVSNPVLQEIIDCAKANKATGITFPDWRNRRRGIDYNQTLIDFFPMKIGEDGENAGLYGGVTLGGSEVRGLLRKSGVCL